MLDVKSMRNMLNELINRTKDFETLDAFRLFVLQHNTYDVDKATKLIKRGKREGLRSNILLYILYQYIYIERGKRGEPL